MLAKTGPGRTSAAIGAVLAATGLVALAPALAGAAAPPQPSYASAVVDGSSADWNAGDTWGTIVSNDPPKRVVASASLRYDCSAGVLYVLFTAAPGEIVQTIDPEEAYVRLGQTGKLVSGVSGNDGVAPDFAWTGHDGDTATGFEASAAVAPGEYPGSLRIHAKLPDDSADGYETVDLQPRYSDLSIQCPVEETTTEPAKVEGTTVTAVPPTDPPKADPPKVKAIRTVRAPVVVRAELARTGSHAGEMTVVGASLVAAGAVLVLRSRKMSAVS